MDFPVVKTSTFTDANGRYPFTAEHSGLQPIDAEDYALRTGHQLVIDLRNGGIRLQTAAGTRSDFLNLLADGVMGPADIDWITLDERYAGMERAAAADGDPAAADLAIPF